MNDQIKIKAAFLISISILFVCLYIAKSYYTNGCSMRLVETEGNVWISTRDNEMPAIDNMKLYDGYQITTGKDSDALILLDQTKIIKMDEDSILKIQKKNQNLELELKEGRVFFNVLKPLDENETMNIHTSTTVTGIRGTSGSVQVISDTHTQVTILEGRVQTVVANPLTDNKIQREISEGQTADFYVYNKDNSSGTPIIAIKAAERELTK